MSDGDELGRVRRERDLMARILDLDGGSDPGSFLPDALGLALEWTGAKRGYMAVYPPGGRPEQPRWWHAVGCEDVEVARIHRAISHGVITSVLTDRQPLRLINAMLDPAWGQRESIRRNNVEAVICAPIGRDRVVGVLYLQGRPGGGAFSEADLAQVVQLSRWLAPAARRVLDTAPRLDSGADIRGRIDVHDLIGAGEAMGGVLRQIELAARFQIDVLITGPTGAGKSSIARAITRNSARADKPFVEVNCAAIPEALLEAQIFGVAPGAFTGAPPRGAEGFVQAAEGGALFLDEIADLPLSGQAALLQLLSDRQYRRMGDPKSRVADVRVIAATNADLRAAVASGRFREDLLHRLDTLAIRVPSLAERAEDIPEIARSVLARLARQHGVAPLALEFSALVRVSAREWPGNVRQLAKALEVGLLRATMQGRAEIQLDDVLPGEIAVGAEDGDGVWQEETRQFQRRLLVAALDRAGGSATEAAKLLGLARSRVYALIEQFDVRTA